MKSQTHAFRYVSMCMLCILSLKNGFSHFSLSELNAGYDTLAYLKHISGTFSTQSSLFTSGPFITGDKFQIYNCLLMLFSPVRWCVCIICVHVLCMQG